MKRRFKRVAATVLATSLAITLCPSGTAKNTKVQAATLPQAAYEWTFENEDLASTGAKADAVSLKGTASIKGQQIGFGGKNYTSEDNHVLSLEGGSKGSSYADLPKNLYQGISSSTGLTWSFWIKPDSSVSSYSRAFSSTDSSNKNEFAFAPYAQDGVWNVIFDDNASYKQILGSEPEKSQWTLMTIAISEKTIKVYENGALIDSSCGGGDASILKSRLDSITSLVNNSLGRTNSTWSDPDCKLQLDDVRLYTSALNADDIKAIAESYGIEVQEKQPTKVVDDTDDASAGLTEIKELATKSVDGKIEVRVWQNASGEFFYSSYLNGQVTLKCAPLGLVSKKVDLSKGLKLDESSIEITQGKEDYDWIQGSKNHVEKEYKEMSFAVKKDSSTMKVIFRIFEDGIGYRYEVDGDTTKNDEVTEITNEKSSFMFPDSATVWTTSTSATYEPGAYTERTMSYVKNASFNAGPPILATMPNGNSDCWMLLAEANVYNEEKPYCASVFRTESKNAAFKVHFGVYLTQEEDESLDGKTYNASYAQINSVKMEDKFHTPWRVAIMSESLEGLANSSLVSDLNPDAQGDFSWVEPGTSSWSWWSTTNDAIDYDTMRDYVDYAQITGQKYCLVDFGWEVWEDYETKLKDLVEYADERGVGILVWYGVNKFDHGHAFDLDSPDEIEKAFAWCESLGIKGVKVDYINSDSQFAMKNMYDIASIAAKHKLVVNYHGCTDPNGENRTFPNILSSEAVQGSEYFKWSSGSAASTLLTLPFTRNVLGSMEFTPVCMSVKNSSATDGFMLAMPIVYESAMQTLAHSCYVYPGYGGTSLLTDIPSTWDDSRLLAGSYPGSAVIRARKSGDTWYLGAMTEEENSYDISLDFLDENENYYAYIYTDKADFSGIQMEKKVVTSKDVLKFNLNDAGGCAVKFSKKDDLKQTILDEYNYYEAETASLGQNTKINASAYVSRQKYVTGMKGAENRLAFKYVDVPEAGVYELKLYVVSSRACDLMIRANKYESNLAEGLIGVDGDGNAVGCKTTKIYLDQGRNAIYLYNPDGNAPGIDRIAVSKWPVEEGTAPATTTTEQELYVTYQEEGPEPTMGPLPTRTPVPTAEPTIVPTEEPVEVPTEAPIGTPVSAPVVSEDPVSSSTPATDVILPPVSDQQSVGSEAVKVAKVKKVSVKSKKSQITVKFAKVKGVVKYQISYSLDRKFKKAKKVSTKVTSVTIKKLKSKKTYYVRVRAMAKSGSKTIYSAWSAVKKVKVK